MDNKKMFRIFCIDEGYCRINYKAKNDDNETIFYCLLDVGNYDKPNIVLHRSTRELEPSHPVKLRESIKAIDSFEMPEGDSKLVKACQEWIKTH